MRPCWNQAPVHSAVSTPGRTRTCDLLRVKEPPSPLGHGSSQVVPAGFEPAISTMSGWRALRCSARLWPPAFPLPRGERVRGVGPAGVEPASYRVSDGCLAARSPARCLSRAGFAACRLVRQAGTPALRKRPVRESNPSRLLDRQVATPAASQGGRVSGGSRTRLSDAAGRCLGCSATDTRARTEGVEPSAPVLETGCSPRSTPLSKKLPRQDSNLQPSR